MKDVERERNGRGSWHKRKKNQLPLSCMEVIQDGKYAKGNQWE